MLPCILKSSIYEQWLANIIFRRIARHERKRGDVFKGSLSEGQVKRRPYDSESEEELKNIEIPMDSDDEETQIRKRREARQKMMQRLQVNDERYLY